MNKNGFSLVEILIYIGIFSISAVFLVSILTVVARIQLNQSSVHELDQQLAFVNDIIRYRVQNSNFIDIDTGVPTTTLRLLTSSSSMYTTLIYASNSIIYLEERPSVELGGNSRITPLTDSRVNVNSFYVTKYDNPGSFSVARVDLSMSYNTDNPQAMLTRTLQTGITRISAAQFDSSVNPNSSNSLDLGTTGLKWRKGYFSSDLEVGGDINIGTAALRNSNGNIAVSTSLLGKGIIMRAPGGSCYLVSVANGGSVTSTSISCP